MKKNSVLCLINSLFMLNPVKLNMHLNTLKLVQSTELQSA